MHLYKQLSVEYDLATYISPEREKGMADTDTRTLPIAYTTDRLSIVLCREEEGAVILGVVKTRNNKKIINSF